VLFEEEEAAARAREALHLRPLEVSPSPLCLVVLMLLTRMMIIMMLI
jgi:hypothetical protein